MREFFSPQAYKKEIRAINPQAFALSANEAIRVHKIASIIRQVFDMHREFVRVEGEGSDITTEVFIYNAQSVALIKDHIKAKRINLDNAYKMAQRVLSSNWWEILSIVNTGTNEEDKPKAYLRSSSDTQGEIKREQFPAFYEIYDSQASIIGGYKLGAISVEALREALGLDASYLYLNGDEFYSLGLICAIVEFTEPFIRSERGYVAIKGSNETTSLIRIGSRAISNAEQRDDEDSAAGFAFQTGKGFRINYAGELDTLKKISVSADKLLRQIVSKSCLSHDKIVTITLQEFMDIRGLHDKKTAREQFKRAIKELYNLSYEKMADNGRIEYSARYIQERVTIENSVAAFVLTDRFYYHIQHNGSVEYIPESFFTIPSSSENAYRIASGLADHRRRNIGNPDENRISIKKLLEWTTLPLAETIEKKRLKSYIIDRFFDALKVASRTKEFSYTLVERVESGWAKANRFTAELDYDYFIQCWVEVKWAKEPESYSRLREQKKAEREAAKKGRLEAIKKAAGKKARSKKA